MPDTIPTKKIELYRKLQNTVKDPATSDNERRIAAQNLASLEAEYRGIAYEANKPAGSTSAQEKVDFTALFQNLMAGVQQASAIVGKALGHTSIMEWVGDNATIEMKPSKSGNEFYVVVRLPARPLEKLLERMQDETSIRVFADSVGSAVAQEIVSQLAANE